MAITIRAYRTEKDREEGKDNFLVVGTAKTAREFDSMLNYHCSGDSPYRYFSYWQGETEVPDYGEAMRALGARSMDAMEMEWVDAQGPI